MKNPLIFFALFFFALPALAAPDIDPAALDEQNRLMQRQQQIERGEAEQKELKRVQQEEQEFEEGGEDEELEKESGKVVQDLRSIQFFRIREINLSQNKIIPKIVEKSFTDEYLNQCLTINRIIKLRKKLASYLVDKGYVTSRVVIPRQSLQSGVLNIEVIESGLEKIQFNEEKFFDKTQRVMAFGFNEEEEILNLRKIEQGIEQINRLPSNRATIKILPGSRDKTSIISIENKPQRRTRLSVGHDNNGSKTTGQSRQTIGLSQDNLLWLNDTLSLSRTGNSLDDDRKQGGSNSFSSNFSVPFGWYNLTLSYSNSAYRFWTNTQVPRKSSGYTSTKAVNLERVLIKEKAFKISSSIGLTERYNRSFQDEQLLEVQSRKASIGSISFPGTFFLADGSLYVKPTYSKGLKILDAKKGPIGLAGQGAVYPQFDLLRFYTNYSKRFQVAQMPLAYNLTFDSQISKQHLYGIDQFYVGGAYSVRGFQQGSISGDSGYSLKNEFTFNVGQSLLPYFNKLTPYASSLNHFSLTPFYDYGHVQNKTNSESGRLSGAGLKIGFNHQNLTASLVVSWALSKSQNLGRRYGENNAVFLNLSSEVGFF